MGGALFFLALFILAACPARAAQSLDDVQPAEVPNVVGEPLERAVEIFARFRIPVEQVDTIFREQPDLTAMVRAPIPEGSVVRQLPEAGSRLQEGLVGRLWVISYGRPTPPPETRTVPRVVGQPEERAVAVLAEAGIDVRRIEPTSSAESSGIVLDQVPTAGMPLVQKMEGALWVSAGPEPEPQTRLMPRVVGMVEERAFQLMDRIGVPVRRVDRVTSAEPEGMVVDQLPSEGTPVGPDAEGALWVSAGPPPPGPDTVAPPDPDSIVSSDTEGATRPPPTGGAATEPAEPFPWPTDWTPGLMVAVTVLGFLMGRTARPKKSRSGKGAPASTTPSPVLRSRAVAPRGSVEVDGPLLPQLDVGLRARKDASFRVELETPADGPLAPPE